MWFGIPTPDRSVIPQVASLVGIRHRRRVRLAGPPADRPARRSGGGSGRSTSPARWPQRGLPVRSPAWRRRSCRRPADLQKLAFAVVLRARDLVLELRRHRRSRCASCRSPARRVRYVADASYWIYSCTCRSSRRSRCWSATAVALERQVPADLVVSLAVLFASYRYLVRSTFIGQMLNGRRYPRHPAAAPLTAAIAASTTPRPTSATGPAEPTRGSRRSHGAGQRSTACTSATARPSRSPASISTSGAASCWRCSARTAPGSRRRSRCGSDCSSPTRARAAARRVAARRRDAGGRSAS